MPRDRQLAIEPLQLRYDTARDRVVTAYERHAVNAERLARINVKILMPHLTPAGAVLVGKLRTLATELRESFDYNIEPTGVRSSMRATFSAKSDAEFTNALRDLVKSVERYENVSNTVSFRAKELDAALALLNDSIWSEAFTLHKTPEFGFITSKS
jgi:hypothetical protein